MSLLNKDFSDVKRNDNYIKRIKTDFEKYYSKMNYPFSAYIMEHNNSMFNFLNSNLANVEYKKGQFNISKLLLLSLFHETRNNEPVPRLIRRELGSLYHDYLDLKNNDFNPKAEGTYYSSLFEKNLPLLIFRTLDISKLPLNGDKDLLVNWFNFNPKKIEEEKRNLATVMYNVYHPIADILGFNSVLNDIKNLSVQTLYPDNYRKIDSNMRSNYEYLNNIKKSFTNELQTLININSNDVSFFPFEEGSYVKGRIKSAGSIVLKMIEKDLPITKMLELHDLVAFTILVEDVNQARYFWNFIKDVYNHGEMFSEDFITNPRGRTGYQALHVDVFHKGVRVEIQIKTPEMYVRSEHGEWSHAIYKNEEMKPGLLKLAEFASILKTSDSFKSNAPFLNLRGSRIIAFYNNEGARNEIYLDKYSTIFDLIVQSKVSKDPFKVKVFSSNTGCELFYTQLVNDGSSYMFEKLPVPEKISKKKLYDIRACSISGEANLYLSNLILKR